MGSVVESQDIDPCLADKPQLDSISSQIQFHSLRHEHNGLDLSVGWLESSLIFTYFFWGLFIEFIATPNATLNRHYTQTATHT